MLSFNFLLSVLLALIIILAFFTTVKRKEVIASVQRRCGPTVADTRGSIVTRSRTFSFLGFFLGFLLVATLSYFMSSDANTVLCEAAPDSNKVVVDTKEVKPFTYMDQETFDKTVAQLNKANTHYRPSPEWHRDVYLQFKEADPAHGKVNTYTTYGHTALLFFNFGYCFALSYTTGIEAFNAVAQNHPFAFYSAAIGHGIMVCHFSMMLGFVLFGEDL